MPNSGKDINIISGIFVEEVNLTEKKMEKSDEQRRSI